MDIGDDGAPEPEPMGSANEDAELERFSRVDEIVTAAVAGASEGKPLDISGLVAAHPELGKDLRGALVAAARLERALPLGAASLEFNAREPAPSFVGPYRILRELGRGGMGVVYEAEDASLDRNVAIKLLPLAVSKSRGFVARFEREARAAARLEHPNVVPIFRVGEAQGRHFIVMKCVDGDGLDSLLGFYADGATSVQGAPTPDDGSEPKATASSSSATDPQGSARLRRIAREMAGRRLGAFDTGSDVELVDEEAEYKVAGELPVLGRLFHRNVARVGLSCATALGYAHARGVLHRDVKPGNILVDRRGHVWITDFGLAKLDELDDLTREGDLVGTLRYMAPEQFQGHAEARSDVYALGLVLYELLTQRRALEGKSRAELIHSVLYQVPKRPDEISPGVPSDLARIVMKAIAKLPQERYRTADAMAADLRAFLEGRPIAARLPSAMYLARLAFHRNRALAASIAVMAVALIFGAALYVLQLQKASVAEERLAYRANLAAAASSIRNAETPTAFQRLSDCPEGLRGWEWDHLASSADQSLRTIKRLEEPIEDLRFDGDELSIIHRRGLLIISGAEHRSLSMPGTTANLAEIVSVVPIPGGDWLSFHFRHGLWRTPSDGWPAGDIPSPEVAAGAGIRVTPTMIGTTQMALAPEHGRAVVASRTGRVMIVDTETMEVVIDVQTNLRGVEVLELNSDATTAFVVSGDGCLSALDLGTGDVQQIFRAPSGLAAVALSRDGELLAAGGIDQTIYLVERSSGIVLHQLVGHSAAINDLDFSGDGVHLASAAGDKTLRIWDVQRGVALQALRGHARSAEVIKFHPNGRRLVSGSNSGVVKEWAVGIAGGRLRIEDHYSDVVGAGFAADGSRFATGGREGTVRIYDAGSLQLDVLCEGHRAEVNGIVWHAGDRRITSVDRRGSVHCWSTLDGTERWRHQMDGVAAEPCLSIDESRVFTGTFGGEICTLDADSGQVLAEGRFEGISITSVAIGPEGEDLFVGCIDGLLLQLDPLTLKERDRFYRHTDRISAIRFPPDGSKMVTASFDRTLGFSEPDSLEASRHIDLGHEGNSWYTDAIADAAISPDGRLVAVASHNWLVRLVSMDTGALVLDLAGHRRWVRKVKFSPDGRTLLSTESFASVRLWDDHTSHVREAAKAKRLELEAAARARIEQLLGRPMSDPDDYDEAERRLPEIAEAHFGLRRVATAVIHQARSRFFVEHMTRRLARDSNLSSSESALAYIAAMGRAEPLGAKVLCLGVLGYWGAGNASAARLRLVQAKDANSEGPGVDLLIAALAWHLAEGDDEALVAQQAYMHERLQLGKALDDATARSAEIVAASSLAQNDR